jgi:hypothetical protein
VRLYILVAILIAFTASCAATDKSARTTKKEPVASTYKYIEKREKSKNAVDRIAIGKTGGLFYYDGNIWAVKEDQGSQIDFVTRRFTNARIFHYPEAVPMTDIYKKLIESYALKNPKLVESEFIEVNGEAVIFNKLEGIHNKREISILSYGFSGKSSTIIVHGFTYKSMLREETEQEIIDFLNGFDMKG